MNSGRPPVLTEEQKTFLIDMITDMHGRKYYPSYDEIRTQLEDNLKLILTNDQIRNFIRNNTEFNLAIGDCMDQERIDSSDTEIDEFYDNLKEATTGVDARFVYNLDEVGEEEYGDAQEITVVVPKSYTKTRIPIGFVRRKRCTGLVCISMNRENPKPLIITPRKTIDSEIFHYVQKSTFNCEYQQNGFITKTIFKRRLINTFIPFVNQQRIKYDYKGDSILIMDGLKAHVSIIEEAQELLAQNNIRILFLVPHTSDQCQPLDLGVFSNQKRITQAYRVPWNLSAQSKQIIKILQGIFQSTNPIQCFLAFKQAGIVYCEKEDSERPYVEIKRGMCRAVRHYQKDFIEDIEPISKAQEEAIITRFDADAIHKSSHRIKLNECLKKTGHNYQDELIQIFGNQRLEQV